MRSGILLLTVLFSVAAPCAGQTRNSSPAAVHYRIGLELLANEYWDDAVEAFRKAIELDAEFALAHYGLGRAEMGRQDYDAAISALTACRKLYLAQASADAAREMHLLQRRQEQMEQLREAIREQLTGPQSASRQRLVRHLQDQLSDLESRGLTNDLDLQISAPAFVLLSLGSAYFRTGALADAEREYLAAAKANPKMGEIHNNLAVVYLLTGRYALAEKAVGQAERNRFRVNPQLKEDIKTAKAESR